MNTLNTQPLPTMLQMIKATAIALAVGMVILITVVLPAEYGIDPTGVGKTIGLTGLNGAGMRAAETPASATTAPGLATGADGEQTVVPTASQR